MRCKHFDLAFAVRNVHDAPVPLRLGETFDGDADGERFGDLYRRSARIDDLDIEQAGKGHVVAQMRRGAADRILIGDLDEMELRAVVKACVGADRDDRTVLRNARNDLKAPLCIER